MGAEDTSKASRFIEGLCGIQADSDGSIQRLQFGQIWQQRPSCFRPVHCSLNCDKHWGETFANVITSLPFIVLGLQAPRKSWSSKLYANSLIGVGIASSLYHTSRGDVRKYLRWADYTMIATTTVCLSRALREENPKFLMTASTMLLPFQPMMVSALHMGMMEVSFAKRASVKPELRMAHSLHTMSGLLGGALFFADDCFPETPYLHAAWHLAAAFGTKNDVPAVIFTRVLAFICAWILRVSSGSAAMHFF